jgi:RNA polymerase sigma-70 factor (ECF subfamily)
MQAFDALVLRHRSRVCALARFVLGSAEEAEDVAQETFVRAYEALSRYECRGQFRVWIATICANLCRNRMKGRRPATAIDLAEGALLADPAPGPEAHSLARERARIVRQCLEQLGARDRLILGLHYQEQASIEEIARITGIRAGAVKVALHRARKRLRLRLERAGLLSD